MSQKKTVDPAVAARIAARDARLAKEGDLLQRIVEESNERIKKYGYPEREN